MDLASDSSQGCSQSSDDPFVAGGGESGALIRSMDWSKTSVGPIVSWPKSLKLAIRIMLDCKLPMYIAWGREHIQFYNDAYKPILGDKHVGAMGSRVQETWSEIWPTVGPMWEEVWAGKSVGYDNFKLTINRFGFDEDVYFNFSYSSVPDDAGNVGGILVTFAETTSKVQTEQALLRERQKLLSVLLQAPVGVCVTEGPSHVFALANPFWYSIMSGGAERDIVGKTVREALPELEKQGYFELLDQVYSTGVPYVGSSARADLLLPNQSSRRIYIDFVYAPKRDLAGNIDGILCVFTDVTERQEAIERFKVEQRMREQFVATLTHDLRNPLTAAKTSAQLIGRLADTNEKQTVLAGRIVESLNRANRMIENLLDANRIKVGEPLLMDLQEHGLYSLVTETLEDLTTIYGDRFVLKTEQKVINGYWSADALRRILENLCGNAIKYGDEIKPITVELSSETKDVFVKVHNFGRPIPKDRIQTLFEPFQRVEGTAAGVKGWGLGLTLVKGLTEAHGGSVSVESSAEAGTFFTVRLPKDARLESGNATSL